MVTYLRHMFTCDVKLSLNNTDGSDLENDQISTTWTPKMELKSSKGTQKGAHEPAKTPAGWQKTYKETKEVTAGSHGDARWSCRGRLATNNKRTWLQHGVKKVPKKGPNERP